MSEILKDAFGHDAGSIPELNYELLEEAVSWANWSAEAPYALQKEVGYLWDQSSWGRTSEEILLYDKDKEKAECGSSFCIAGYAALSAGFTMQDTHEVDGRTVKRMALDPQKVQIALSLPDDEVADDYWDPDEHWSHLAEKLLGLTYYEASSLFDGENDISMVIEKANCIAAHRGYSELNLNRWQFKKTGEETDKEGVVYTLGRMEKKTEWYDAEIQNGASA